jgi:hypothetical protein
LISVCPAAQEDKKGIPKSCQVKSNGFISAPEVVLVAVEDIEGTPRIMEQAWIIVNRPLCKHFSAFKTSWYGS